MFSTSDPDPARTRRLLDDYVAIARRRKGGLAATAVRTRSLDARDLLAHAVGATATPQTRILAAARDEDHGWLAAAGPELCVDSLADVARVIALQELLPADAADAYAIYELIIAVLGPDRVGPRHQALHVQLAYRLGHRDRARALLAAYPQLPGAVREAVQLDLMNPYAGGDDPAGWAGAFSRLLPGDGVRLTSRSDVPPFDRLSSSAALLAGAVQPGWTAARTTGGPLISVVLAAGTADDTTLRSLLEQSWENLEVLVAGDVTVTDPRIRRVAPDGPGDSRNAALGLATGEFVAFQDTGWSHPRRLQEQLAVLLADPDAVASTSVTVQVGADLTLTRPGCTELRTVSPGSLLFRRERVLGRLGYLDTVSDGSTDECGTTDEYLARIATTFGAGAVRHVDTPYALARRSDRPPGRNQPVRAAYREAYTAWHDAVRSGTADPYRSQHPVTRAFPAPLRTARNLWSGRPGGGDTRATEAYDVILGGEWSAFGGPQKSMIEEIKALTARGRRVAVMHLDAFRFMSEQPRPLCAQVRRLIADGVVDRVLPGDEADTSLLIVRYPPVLQFTSALPTGIRAKRMLILANQAPSERDGSDARYLPRTCADNARRLFGTTALWAPQGPAVRDFLQRDLPADELTTFDVPGVIDADAWYVRRTWLRGERPVVGKHSRDNWAKWPADRATLLQAYPAALDIDVRLMGGVDCARALLSAGDGDGELPHNWRVYGYDEIDVPTFLGQLDFFVYFPHPNMVEGFGRAILEAMAAGCVVLLPYQFRRTFGDAALYCRPDEVEGVVRHLHRDPEAFLQLSRDAQQHVRATFSHATYADLVSSLID